MELCRRCIWKYVGTIIMMELCWKCIVMRNYNWNFVEYYVILSIRGMLEILQKYAEIILELCWKYSGNDLNCIEITLELRWSQFGNTLEICHRYLEMIFERHWKYSESKLEIHRNYVGNRLESMLEFCWNHIGNTLRRCIGNMPKIHLK